MTKTAERPHGDERDLTIQRRFNGPRERIFEMWSDPLHVLNWWGPTDAPAISFENEFTVGGEWRACLEKADGSGQKIRHGGRYLEIEPPEKIVFTFAWEGEAETVVSVVLTEIGSRETRMVFHQTPFETVASRDSHGEGWNSTFDRLATVQETVA